jgi:hypothetical protein
MLLQYFLTKRCASHLRWPKNSFFEVWSASTPLLTSFGRSMAFSLKVHSTTTIALFSRLETDITHSLSNISTERIIRKSRRKRKKREKTILHVPGSREDHKRRIIPITTGSSVERNSVLLLLQTIATSCCAASHLRGMKAESSEYFSLRVESASSRRPFLISFAIHTPHGIIFFLSRVIQQQQRWSFLLEHPQVPPTPPPPSPLPAPPHVLTNKFLLHQQAQNTLSVEEN